MSSSALLATVNRYYRIEYLRSGQWVVMKGWSKQARMMYRTSDHAAALAFLAELQSKIRAKGA